MGAGGRRFVPLQVRVAVTGFNAIGGVMLTLTLAAVGVLLSGMQVDPARQGGTGYLDFVLFFNAVLFLFPLAVVLVFLGVRIKRGEHWAWLASLVFWAFVGTMAPLLTWLLPAPTPFAVVPAVCAGGLLALLLTPQARTHCADVDD
ncbi:hypothetical protein KZZ52_50360 [Dactylosporangium sp. AC04546]|uniref:hypothetical protein n=1 Tax=Dactylosporangium sp. AC04546 TaxID=2862460 RepID=UPI001EDF2A66|nr:hypothetical protein [Dactylosporangium sp. AC04546]WVK82080.1 hypothetical protein KZZ52_50360 [Dactylosporangium sp. AC04546]